MDKLPISVVIVNHNGGMLLCQCVTEVEKVATQVIVVDNCSADTSMSSLESAFAGMSHVVLCALPVNRGFAAGCNVGMGLATQAYLLFLNPDCIVREGALLKMFAALVGDREVGMVGGLLTNEDGSEQGGARRAVPTPWRSFVRAFGLSVLSSRWPKLFFNFHLNMDPLPDRPIDVEAISGALMLVRRDAMDSIGCWDEGYFLHCEDLDLCMRFRQRTWRILFVPDAPVLHFLGHSSKTKPIFVEWHKHKGMLRFYKKFFSHQYPGVLMWLVRLGVWSRFSMLVVRHWFRLIWAHVRGLA